MVSPKPMKAENSSQQTFLRVSDAAVRKAWKWPAFFWSEGPKPSTPTGTENRFANTDLSGCFIAVTSGALEISTEFYVDRNAASSRQSSWCCATVVAGNRKKVSGKIGLNR
jgi:hypothetical protein